MRGYKSAGGKRERILDWDDIREKYNVAQLTNKGQSLVYLWSLCRVWNTNALLLACHWNMEDGREVENKKKEFQEH